LQTIDVFQGKMSSMFFYSSNRLADEKESMNMKKIYRELIVELIQKK
jgi:hypothetical protein